MLDDFTQSNIFPEIGDAQSELSPALSEHDEAGLFLLKETLGRQTINKERDHIRVPKCEHSHVAAVYLSIIMSRFIWFHELAHCKLGHVLYVQSGVFHAQSQACVRVKQNYYHLLSFYADKLNDAFSLVDTPDARLTRALTPWLLPLYA